MISRHAGRIACSAAFLAICTAAQDPSFVLSTTDTRNYTPAALGNGVISLETTPLAISPAHTFLAGVYDHTPGDTPRIAAAPSWNQVAIGNGDGWLDQDISPKAISGYRQSLDMYDGTLETRYVWTDNGKELGVRVEQFVSRDDAALSAMRMELTPHWSGRLIVRFSLRNWPAPHRYLLEKIAKLDPVADRDHSLIWYPGHLDMRPVHREGATLSTVSVAPGTGVETGEALTIEASPGGSAANSTNSNGEPLELEVKVRAGERCVFTQYVALARGTEISQTEEAAKNAAEAAQRSGWEKLRNASADAWHALWRTDILVDGDPSLQLILHALQFHLLAAARAGSALSVAPMGLSSADYHGHIFWDADTFMFPPLLVLHPDLARSMVEFRSRTRAAALENARRNHFRGAMYPWEAGPDGEESTPRFAFQNASSENHVNGDIALAAWQYWLATGDQAWLKESAWPIVRDTADFWASRVHLNRAKDRYEIANVVAVKESDIGVSNDPYTNAVAQKNFQLAGEAARLLDLDPHPEWARMAEKMFVPESNSSLLWFPLERSFAPAKTQQVLQVLLPRFKDEQGAMMGGEFYPIMAAQISDRAMIGHLLRPMLMPYLRPPFDVTAETPENQNTIFLTGAGAALQQFVFGYTGLRLTNNGLQKKFPATLPPGIRRLTLQNIAVGGKRETLTFP